MASDIFVYWKHKSGQTSGQRVKPSREQVLKVIHQFFGTDVASARWSEDRFLVRLLGERSEALCDVAPYRTAAQNAASKEQASEGRWIEVWIGLPQQRSSQMDVITRFGDDYTNACALGLAKAFALGWDGTMEVG